MFTESFSVFIGVHAQQCLWERQGESKEGRKLYRTRRAPGVLAENLSNPNASSRRKSFVISIYRCW